MHFLLVGIGSFRFSLGLFATRAASPDVAQGLRLNSCGNDCQTFQDQGELPGKADVDPFHFINWKEGLDASWFTLH